LGIILPTTNKPDNRPSAVVVGVFTDFDLIAQFVLDAWQPFYFLIAEMGIL
jgi:hypothetical protein